jgi:hypothetical protein
MLRIVLPRAPLAIDVINVVSVKVVVVVNIDIAVAPIAITPASTPYCGSHGHSRSPR